MTQLQAFLRSGGTPDDLLSRYAIKSTRHREFPALGALIDAASRLLREIDDEHRIHGLGDSIMQPARELADALAAITAPTPPARPEVAGLYVASKAKHGAMWKALRASGVPIVSTWIDEFGEGETASWSDSWSRFVQEASSARAVIFYCEAGEVHKGALVEIGCALAAGRPIFVVGPIDHSWINHPLVSRCESITAALAAVGGQEGG